MVKACLLLKYNEKKQHIGYASIRTVITATKHLEKTNRLLKDDPDNIQILNRITLSRIKTFGKPDTYDWLKENESNFRNIQYPTEGEINEYICKCGVEVSPGLIAFSIKLYYYDKVYDLLKN